MAICAINIAGTPQDSPLCPAPQTIWRLWTPICATGSLCEAADSVHLHHSSVARRLEQIGKAMGIDLTEPTGLTRARLALAAWRLLDD
jgi:hypothetical protein